MRKKDDKTRTISFFSQKNHQVIVVANAMAKKYALAMEKDDSVIKYEVNIPLTDFAILVDGKGLRRKLLETEWVSDFMVVRQSGTKIVEIVDMDIFHSSKYEPNYLVYTTIREITVGKSYTPKQDEERFLVNDFINK